MKIGIIGASSQVGSSLALHLKEHTGIIPVCFIRSVYPAIFFEISGIEYRILDTNNPVGLKKIFSDIDLFVDCGYPSGQLYEITKQIKAQLNNLFAAMPRGASFIYCSTIMAFGMPDQQKKVKNYIIPRSTYAYLKRIAEKTVRNLSGKNSIDGFIFRLGQVHGFLQSVNGSYREKLSMNKTITVEGNPGDLVNIIFIETLAEAVIRAGTKKIPAGTYSLVNFPQWTLKQLYDHYTVYYSLQNEVRYITGFTQPAKSPRYKISLGSLKKYRALPETFFLTRSKNIYIKVKGKYRLMNIKRSINESSTAEYSDFHLLGQNPGKMLIDLPCKPQYIFDKEKEMDSLYNKSIETHINKNQE